MGIRIPRDSHPALVAKADTPVSSIRDHDKHPGIMCPHVLHHVFFLSRLLLVSVNNGSAGTGSTASRRSFDCGQNLGGAARPAIPHHESLTVHGAHELTILRKVAIVSCLNLHLHIKAVFPPTPLLSAPKIDCEERLSPFHCVSHTCEGGASAGFHMAAWLSPKQPTFRSRSDFKAQLMSFSREWVQLRLDEFHHCSSAGSQRCEVELVLFCLPRFPRRVLLFWPRSKLLLPICAHTSHAHIHHSRLPL